MVASTLAALGEPQRSVASVLVTGTNGKGSTAAMIATILAHRGARTGLFTSPALDRPHEQIRLREDAGGAFESIDDDAFAKALGRTLETAEALDPGRITAFEATTIAAFSYFADREVDWAVLEAGLGGARDATNVADPAASVLVSVGHDHAAFLGDDLESIAREKAGTFRPGRPAIIGWLPPEAEAAVRAAAAETGSRPHVAADRILELESVDRGLAPQRVALTTARARYAFDLPLLGAHQARNAAVAILTVEALVESGALDADSLDADTPDAFTSQIEAALATCRWPGRLEVLALPTAGDRETTLLVDAAHNRAGADALATFLETLGRPFTLVFGAFKDKDAEAMLERLAPMAERVYLVPTGDARSFDPMRFVHGFHHAVHLPSVEAALDAVTGAATDAEHADLIVACGSLRVVAAARRFAHERETRS